MELLKQILMQTKLSQVSGTPINSTSALIVHKGNEITNLLSHTISEDHWIVDTGAAYHMSGLQSVCSSYQNHGVDIKISTDGSISKAAVVGNVHLSNMNLQCLNVPYIRCNLNLNYAETFFPSQYEFQDLISGRMIDRAEE